MIDELKLRSHLLSLLDSVDRNYCILLAHLFSNSPKVQKATEKAIEDTMNYLKTLPKNLNYTGFSYEGRK